jgi:hypothetical protein
MNEEEREKICARRASTKRLGSVETEGGDSPHVRGPPTTSQRRALYRKTVSVGDTIAEADDLWKSHDSRGSNESLASNTSIPLPIPVRWDKDAISAKILPSFVKTNDLIIFACIFFVVANLFRINCPMVWNSESG